MLLELCNSSGSSGVLKKWASQRVPPTLVGIKMGAFFVEANSGIFYVDAKAKEPHYLHSYQVRKLIDVAILNN